MIYETDIETGGEAGHYYYDQCFKVRLSLVVSVQLV